MGKKDIISPDLCYLLSKLFYKMVIRDIFKDVVERTDNSFDNYLLMVGDKIFAYDKNISNSTFSEAMAHTIKAYKTNKDNKLCSDQTYPK